MLANRTYANCNERLSSPGIPGDYFECDEIMLVQKLNLLRCAQPLQVPSLLDSGYTKSHNEISGNGSDISPEDLLILASADTYSPKVSQDALTRLRQRRPPGGDVPASAITNEREPSTKTDKSWEGFDLVLEDESNPSVSCDSSPTSSSKFPNNVLLFKHIRRPRTFLNGGWEDSKSHATPATASMSVSYASTSSYSQRRQQLRKKFKFPAEVTLRRNGSGTDQDDTQYFSPLHHELTIKHSSSSSRPEEDEISQSYSSEPFLQDELFVKLSEDSDLEAFKAVNNFSFEGDYLFSRILRERTRIQMKKNMLKDGDVDLLCDLHKREVSNKNSERGVYYEI